MKHIIAIIVLAISFSTYSQTQADIPTKDDFIGLWEWQNNNEIFRVNLFDYQEDGETGIGGHFTMLQVDNNGNETVLYTSNRLIEGTNDYWRPMITGCRYLDYNESYRFFLRDNTSDYFLLGDLYLKFLNNLNSGQPLQISWKLRPGGTRSQDEIFNVPTDIVLTKM